MTIKIDDQRLLDMLNDKGYYVTLGKRDNNDFAPTMNHHDGRSKILDYSFVSEENDEMNGYSFDEAILASAQNLLEFSGLNLAVVLE